MGALKAALTAIFATNTYTSSSSGIGSKFVGIYESTGAASGIMNMANLASVLGAQVTTNSSDLYNLPHVGLYYWNSQSESPSNAAVPQGSLVQFTEYGSMKILKQYANSGYVFFNLKWGSNNWKGWQVDYNGYMLSDSAILAPLASALSRVGNTTEVISDSVSVSGDYQWTSARGGSAIKIYSINLLGDNIENYLLVAVCDRAKWQKDVQVLWNNRALSSSTLSITKNDSQTDGYTISVTISNGNTAVLSVKKVSF